MFFVNERSTTSMQSSPRETNQRIWVIVAVELRYTYTLSCWKEKKKKKCWKWYACWWHVPEARLTKTLGVISLRYCNLSTFNTSRNTYFVVYGFKILCEISKGTIEISHNVVNPYTAKCAVYCLVFLRLSYDSFELWRHKPLWDGSLVSLPVAGIYVCGYIYNVMRCAYM